MRSSLCFKLVNGVPTYVVAKRIAIGALDAGNADFINLQRNHLRQFEMGDFFVQPDGALPDRAMQPLEEVFHL